MDLWQSFILGLVQGLTEFLPVSSSGHLVLLQRILGLEEAVFTFDVMVHLGTLLAVIIAFWRDLVEIIRRPLGKLPLLIVAGAIPTAVIGLLFSDFFAGLFASGQSLGPGFIVTGIVLWAVEGIRANNQRKSLREMDVLDAITVGLAQGLAIIPALSRSGLTISAALVRGLNRELAARYSFLLSLPVILGASILEIKGMDSNMEYSVGLLPILIGTITAGVSGFLAIKFMLRVLARGSLRRFSYYVWLLGTLVLIDQVFFQRYFPPLF